LRDEICTLLVRVHRKSDLLKRFAIILLLACVQVPRFFVIFILLISTILSFKSLYFTAARMCTIFGLRVARSTMSGPTMRSSMTYPASPASMAHATSRLTRLRASPSHRRT
jgi:hypothetical protein